MKQTQIRLITYKDTTILLFILFTILLISNKYGN